MLGDGLTALALWGPVTTNRARSILLHPIRDRHEYGHVLLLLGELDDRRRRAEAHIDGKNQQAHLRRLIRVSLRQRRELLLDVITGLNRHRLDGYAPFLGGCLDELQRPLGRAILGLV